MASHQVTGPVGEAEAVQTSPPPQAVELIGAPPAAACGRAFLKDLDIRIDGDGRWYYHGSPIERKELVCLFAQALVRDREGDYWLVTPTEIGRVTVEDAPFVCVELFASGDGCRRSISLRTNVDEIVTVDAAHPLTIVTDPVTGEPRPYVDLDRGMAARLSRSVYYELVALGAIEAAGTNEGAGAGTNEVARYGVWSAGCFFALGTLDDPP